MDRTKRILVLPHVGTAFGHLIRTSEFINQNYSSNDNVTMVVPINAIKFCEKHIPKFVKIILQKEIFSINNSSGIIDALSFTKLIKELEKICLEVKPDIIIGDPGIRASILASKFQIEWIGIMHGCYLPEPEIKSNQGSSELRKLIHLAWKVANNGINQLIQIGTEGRFSSWDDIRKTGDVLIPNKPAFEPSSIGKHISKPFERIGWDKGNPVDLLITCCSEGAISPSESFLNAIMKSSQQITIAGVPMKDKKAGTHFIGNNFSYESLVNYDTTVITHGGHGTLKAIENAKKVFMIPSDIDQLCNSIIAHINHGWDLVFDKNWLEIVNSDLPFKRETYWENLIFETLNGEIELKGLDIFPEKDILFSPFYYDSATCV